MITSITVLSYEDMLERAMYYRIRSNAFVVSIIDPEQEPIFEEDTDRIITLKFHDLDPEWPVDPERDPRPSYVFMNAEQARQIVNHVLRFHGHPAPWECLVNCMAGVSRSGAVGTFVQRVAGIPHAEFLGHNPGLFPNGHVLKLLMVELSNREHAHHLGLRAVLRRPVEPTRLIGAPERYRDAGKESQASVVGKA